MTTTHHPFVTQKNQTKCLILKGVSDLVSSAGGEAYDDMNVFIEGTRPVMESLVNSLPGWIQCAQRGNR